MKSRRYSTKITAMWGLLSLQLLALTTRCLSQSCDPSGAASMCKAACDPSADDEVPAIPGSCQVSAAKCCTYRCNGAQSLCFENGISCASRGCASQTALPATPCMSNGLCCQNPPRPDNWQGLWPPYFPNQWKQEYVFPSGYNWPKNWPNSFAEPPKTAYPEGVPTIELAPLIEGVPETPKQALGSLDQNAAAQQPQEQTKTPTSNNQETVQPENSEAPEEQGNQEQSKPQEQAKFPDQQGLPAGAQQEVDQPAQTLPQQEQPNKPDFGQEQQPATQQEQDVNAPDANAPAPDTPPKKAKKFKKLKSAKMKKKKNRKMKMKKAAKKSKNVI